MTSTRKKPTSRRGRRGGDGRVKLVLDDDVAHEVVDLIGDEPGDADEDLLDRALGSIHEAGRTIPAADQRRIGEGRAVAVETEPDTIRAVETLIVEDRATSVDSLRRLADRLRAKLRRASRR